MSKKADASMSRRSVLKTGAAAVGGAAAALGGGTRAQQPQAPAVLRGAQTGRRFRAMLGGPQNPRLEELRLLPIQERHVVVRTEATAPCATTVLDPNVEGNNLVPRIQELCKGQTDRLFAGGRGAGGNRGPDFAIEAVGRCGDRPKVEQPPDPTGVLPMLQAWQMTRRGGSIIYLCAGQLGNVSFPAGALANNGRTLISGQQGGINMMRDLPRFVRLVEKGQLDLKSMVTSTWRLDQLRDAFQVLSDRTEMCPVVVFS